MIMTGALERAEFVKLRYRVRLLEAVDVDLATLLRLRRNFRAAGSYTFYHANGGADDSVHPFSALFSPPVAEDPVARQRYQQSGAAFVLQPDPLSCRRYERDELLTFPVVLWGGRQEQIAQLARVFQALGKNGLMPEGLNCLKLPVRIPPASMPICGGLAKISTGCRAHCVMPTGGYQLCRWRSTGCVLTLLLLPD